MDDIYDQLPAPQEVDSRLVSGWSALEQGDIDEARAALHDVYDRCPAHPALPLLAAGIRRVRPRRFPWRVAVIVAVIVVAAGAVGGGYALSSRSPRVLPSEPILSSASVPVVSPSDMSSADVPSSPTGTGGELDAPTASEPPRHRINAPSSDDALIQESIARFASAYRSRWRPLTFDRCDLARQPDTATATCRTRSSGQKPDAGSEDFWTFRLQKSASVWKILSVQPALAPNRPERSDQVPPA